MVADEIPKITFNTVTIPKVSYCQSESLNGCDAAATCQNIQYSNQEEFYICECNEGYLDKDASKPGTVCLQKNYEKFNSIIILQKITKLKPPFIPLFIRRKSIQSTN